MDLITSTRLEKVASKDAKLKVEIQAIGAYAGALRALQIGYRCIVGSLLNTILDLMNRQTPGCTDLPWDQWEIKVMVTAVQDCLQPDTSSVPDESKRLYNKFVRQANVDNSSDGFHGEMVVAASRLPSHSSSHFSCITDRKITGPVYYLEHGETCMSLNEALMWAKVYPYSPLNSGEMINPF